MVDLESPRVRQFYDRLIGLIPCDPDEARADLRAMPRWELLTRYLNWADRFIFPRPRRVVTWDGIRRHGVALQHWDKVCAIAGEIEAGNDLTPYLSDRVAHSGYVRREASDELPPRGVHWADKDYALNAYEMHHLHLSRSGTEELLYVSFSRVDAFFLMVGNHKSFDDGSLAEAVAESRAGTSHELKGVTLQSPRPMKEYNQIQRRGFATFLPVGDGQLVMGATLSGAGTSWLHSHHAQQVLRVIARLDPQLDAPRFGSEWFELSGKAYPSEPNFEWAMDCCDLCLLETRAQVKIPLANWRR